MFFALKTVKYGRVQLLKNPQYNVHLFSRLLSFFPKKHCFYIILFCIIYAPAKSLGSGFQYFLCHLNICRSKQNHKTQFGTVAERDSWLDKGIKRVYWLLAVRRGIIEKKSWPSLRFPAIYFFRIDVPTSPLRTIVGFLYNIYLCNDGMSQYKS